MKQEEEITCGLLHGEEDGMEAKGRMSRETNLFQGHGKGGREKGSTGKRHTTCMHMVPEAHRTIRHP